MAGHRHSGIWYLSPVPEHFGTKLGPLILCQTGYFISILVHSSIGLTKPDSPTFKKHFTNVYTVNVFISLETNTVCLQKNPWFLRRQICKYTHRKFGKAWVKKSAIWHTERSVLCNPAWRKTHPPILFSQNMEKLYMYKRVLVSILFSKYVGTVIQLVSEFTVQCQVKRAEIKAIHLYDIFMSILAPSENCDGNTGKFFPTCPHCKRWTEIHPAHSHRWQ